MFWILFLQVVAGAILTEEVEPGSAGSFCETTRDCDFNCYCYPTSHMCVYRQREFAFCVSDERCLSRICSCNVCRNRRGDCCSETGECPDNLYCDNGDDSVIMMYGSCYGNIDDGEACDTGNACKSGICSHNRCFGESNGASRF